MPWFLVFAGDCCAKLLNPINVVSIGEHFASGTFVARLWSEESDRNRQLRDYLDSFCYRHLLYIDHCQLEGFAHASLQEKYAKRSKLCLSLPWHWTLTFGNLTTEMNDIAIESDIDYYQEALSRWSFRKDRKQLIFFFPPRLSEPSMQHCWLLPLCVIWHLSFGIIFMVTVIM